MHTVNTVNTVQNSKRLLGPGHVPDPPHPLSDPPDGPLEGSGQRADAPGGASDETEGTTTALVSLASLAGEAREYVLGSRAANTVRAYRADWADFTAWCARHNRLSLPAHPETVALYLTEAARTKKASTLQRRLAGITQAHLAAGHDPPPTRDALVRSVWQGVRRAKGTAARGKDPALTADLRAMVDTLPGGSLLGVRDRALLLLGFAGAMRRSELVGLDAEDVQFTRDGLVVTIRRSKTDQEGSGRKIGIPYGSRPQTCPVRALQDWITASNAAPTLPPRSNPRSIPEADAALYIKEGEAAPEADTGADTTTPLFRRVDRHGNLLPGRLGDRAVALVVKRALVAAGKSPDEVARFAGHSLRAGLATSAAMAGVPERAIQDQTGHKSLPILRRYIRDGSLFRENAAAQVGL